MEPRLLLLSLVAILCLGGMVLSLINIYWIMRDFPELKPKIGKKRKSKSSGSDTEGNERDYE